MIDNDQDAVGHRDRRSFGPASCRDTTILRGKIAVFALGCGMSRLDQEPTGIGIAFARFAAQAFPCAFPIAWTDPHPGRQVPGRRELPHIRSDLGKQSLCHPLADANDLINEPCRFLPTQRRLGFGSLGHLFWRGCLLRWRKLAHLISCWRLRWGKAALDFLTDPLDCLIQLPDEPKMLGEHKPMMGRHLAGKSGLQLLLTGMPPSLR